MPLVKLVVRTPRKLSEAVSAVLFEAGAGGIEELESGRRLIVYAASKSDADGMAERARARLREVLPAASGVALAVEVDEQSDWDSAWTQHLGQVALTPSIVIQPSWDETPAPAGAKCIRFEPKLAFGDGGHATTRLAAAALERACRAEPAVRVLDFGSGTGVLAFVALLSGAQSAVGVDIDPVSLDAARQNAELNELATRATFALPGDLPEADYELVVANLEAPVLLSVASEIKRAARSAKRLILTGFLAERAPAIAAAFAPEFSVEREDSEDDWALLELVRSP
jgi:ribosomal protein L11 methyltransferase